LRKGLGHSATPHSARHWFNEARKNENRSDWWLTVEHIGRELRKLYPPADTPPDLHALFADERRRASAINQNDQSNDSKDNDSKDTGALND
jgi:hypothetical protein